MFTQPLLRVLIYIKFNHYYKCMSTRTPIADLKNTTTSRGMIKTSDIVYSLYGSNRPYNMIHSFITQLVLVIIPFFVSLLSNTPDMHMQKNSFSHWYHVGVYLDQSQTQNFVVTEINCPQLWYLYSVNTVASPLGYANVT